MAFNETYFGSWYLAAADMLKSRSAREVLPTSLRSTEKLEWLLRQFDGTLQHYAHEWEKLSSMHKENGVYRKVAEFVGEPKGLLIDLGCGNANFLAESGNIPSVGVDLNGYCLQLAEGNLRGHNYPVTRYSESTLAFNPEKGFDIKPLQAQIHSDRITLLLDDATKLKATQQALEKTGIKADVVTFMLWGGRNPYESIHFLDPNVGTFDFKSAARLIKYSLMERLPSILKSGGKFYPAIRTSPLAEKLISKIGTMKDMFQDLAGTQGTVRRMIKIPIQPETGLTDIVVRNEVFGAESPVLQLAEIVLK